MLPDELFEIDPEPCDTCSLGISKFVCYDDIRRCQRCVTHLADERGWNQLVLTELEPPQARPPPASFQPRSRRKAVQDERLF